MESWHAHIILSALFLRLLSLMVCQIPRYSHATVYAQSLNFDFLCSTMETDAYVRNMPWDCASYVICMNGEAIPTMCPQGKVYANGTRNSKCVSLETHQMDANRCHRQIWDYIPSICQANPTAKVPSPDGCSHFFDCSILNGGQELMNYIVECPYPTLFSKEMGGCLDHRLVYCGERAEPKAPCEYLQYMQIYDCRGPNCITCTRRHPSCKGLLNGPHYVPQRNDVMIECSDERTVKIMRAATATNNRINTASSPTSSSSTLSESSLPQPASTPLDSLGPASPPALTRLASTLSSVVPVSFPPASTRLVLSPPDSSLPAPRQTPSPSTRLSSLPTTTRLASLPSTRSASFEPASPKPASSPLVLASTPSPAQLPGTSLSSATILSSPSS